MEKNEWNKFQEEHKGLKKRDLVEKYREKKERDKSTGKGVDLIKKKTGIKTRIRCRLDSFREVLKTPLENQHKKDVILKTPFGKLIELPNSIRLERNIVKSIVRNVNCEEMTLTIHEEGNNQVFPITSTDFFEIMGIKDGIVSSSSSSTKEVDGDLLKKYCTLEKNDKYKYINIKKVQEELEKTNDDNVIRQTFVLIALHYIVCPASGGVLGKRYLSYVESPNRLHEQPWATLALESLKSGIQTYIKGAGIEKNLGGCVLFLQLYCMAKRMKELKIGEINDDVVANFCNDWMIDHAPERKRKKNLAKKICQDLKHVSHLIKTEPENVDLGLLLELDRLNKKFQMSSVSGEACTSGGWTNVVIDDLQILKPGQWLSDMHVDFYLQYLGRNASPKVGAISDYHLACTFFYLKLKDILSPKGIDENSFDKLKRWWRGDNIFQKKYIVIPISESSHWSVVIVCLCKSKLLILHLDSLPGIHNTTQIFQVVRRFMEKGEVNHGVTKVREVSIKVPKQPNSNDCGLYALLFIEHFINHAPKRRKENKFKKMFSLECFEAKEIDRLRSKLNSLILKEKEQNLLDKQQLKNGEPQMKKEPDKPLIIYKRRRQRQKKEQNLLDKQQMKREPDIPLITKIHREGAGGEEAKQKRQRAEMHRLGLDNIPCFANQSKMNLRSKKQ